MARSFDIEPASAAQVRRTDKDKLVVIDDDVQNVANSLHDIDRCLRLTYDPDQGIFIVYRVLTHGDGSVEEQLVTTAQRCDQRIVQRIREIGAESYDYAAELDKADAQAERAREHEFEEKIGPLAEQLRHSMRKDLNLGGDRIFVPGD